MTGVAEAQTLADEMASAACRPTVYSNVSATGTTGQDVQGTVRSDSQLDFPIEGDSYIELSSGPGDTGGPRGTSPDGARAYDVYEFSMTIDVPIGVNDLSFAYRFVTDEFEGQSFYRDFFTATVDGTNIARLPDRNFVNVPNVNDAVGYPESFQYGYDNVSPTLIASTDISGSQGSSIDLTFTIADVNDSIVDSGAVIDAISFAENPLNTAPTASFSIDPVTPAPHEQVTLDASASSDPDGTIVEYAWDLDNDGSFEVRTDTPQTTHSFPTTGDYAVTLVVTDDDGATSEPVTNLIPVRAEPIDTPYGEIGPPVDCDGDGRFEDVNGDGSIDDRDVWLLRQFFAQNGTEFELSAAQKAMFDFNEDGAFDGDDAATLEQAIAAGTACPGYEEGDDDVDRDLR